MLRIRRKKYLGARLRSRDNSVRNTKLLAGARAYERRADPMKLFFHRTRRASRQKMRLISSPILVITVELIFGLRNESRKLRTTIHISVPDSATPGSNSFYRQNRLFSGNVLVQVEAQGAYREPGTTCQMLKLSLSVNHEIGS